MRPLHRPLSGKLRKDPSKAPAGVSDEPFLNRPSKATLRHSRARKGQESARSNSEFASTNTKCKNAKLRAKVAEEGTTDELCKRRQMCPRRIAVASAAAFMDFICSSVITWGSHAPVRTMAFDRCCNVLLIDARLVEPEGGLKRCLSMKAATTCCMTWN